MMGADSKKKDTKTLGEWGPVAEGNLRAPVKLFLSHAKADLPRERAGPVYEVLAQLARGPVESWFDAREIPPGGWFGDEIHSGVLSSSALMAVVTDDYSSREWCRREALDAKDVDRPIVVVDAVKGREQRRFPYLGWREEPGMARRVVVLAVSEALRYRHRLESLRAAASEGLSLSTATDARRYGASHDHLGVVEEYEKYGVEADLVEVGQPEPLGVEPDRLDPDERGFFPPVSDSAVQQAVRRFAWGRGMTAMREKMTAGIDARVSLGGNLERFVGQLPGVLEEGLLMLEARKPLYLAGALGGATCLLIDGLEGRDRPEFRLEWARKTIPAYDAVSDVYRRQDLPCPTPEGIAEHLATIAITFQSQWREIRYLVPG